MLWFFVLIFVTFDGLETQHLEGPFLSEESCQAAIRQVGAQIPAWVERATATYCERATVRPT